MKFTIAQQNYTVGDLQYNSNLIFEAAQKASQEGSSLLLTSELSLTGYSPEDLLLRDRFIDSVEIELKNLAIRLKKFGDLCVIVGHPARSANGLQNCISVIKNGLVIATYSKQILPNSSVFDEKRYFISGDKPCIVVVENVRFGLLICEDIWHTAPGLEAKAANAECLIVLNASPFYLGKQKQRHSILKLRATEYELPIIYANQVGGQDELVFDGGSFCVKSDGSLVATLPNFEESLETLDINIFKGVEISFQQNKYEELYSALVLGVRDYISKNGFSGVLIGLSGGIDSALVLVIAVAALGPDRVKAYMMPSQYTADISLIDAKELASNLNVILGYLPIEKVQESYHEVLADEFYGKQIDATEENIQARIRGNFLMALSNKSGWLVLTTGNKSEMAVGYCTLYGDMAGGFAVIKDVVKTDVFALCKYINSRTPVIPERIITRPPSAELRKDQVDQDSLPPYEVLDQILNEYVVEGKSVESILTQGFKRDDVERVTTLINKNEYKRSQAPIGIKVTEKGFGRDWRYPITNKFRESLNA